MTQKKNNGNRLKLEVIEITPKAFKCFVGACPSVFKTNRGTFILIGKTVNQAPEIVKNKVGSDEFVIEIPQELITKLFS